MVGASETVMCENIRRDELHLVLVTQRHVVWWESCVIYKNKCPHAESAVADNGNRATAA